MIVGNLVDNIYRGINTTSVANALQTSSRSVNVLCTLPSINPWAKYKPVNDPNPVLNRDVTKTLWWKGEDGKCGFKIGILQPDGTVKPALTVDLVINADWYYNVIKPNYPRRLADFGGYNSKADPAILTGIEQDVIEINRLNLIDNIYRVGIDIPQSGDPTELYLNDLGGILNNYYLAGAIKKSTDTGGWTQYRGGKLIGGTAEIKMDLTGIYDNILYDVVLFASDNPNKDAHSNLMPLPSGPHSKTKYQIKLNYKFNFVIELNEISDKLLGGVWKDIKSNYPSPDESEDPSILNGFPCPSSGKVYFRGVIKRTGEGSLRVNATDLKGTSESLDDYNMIVNGLSNAIYDSNGSVINQLTTPGSVVGDTKLIIIGWNYSNKAIGRVLPYINGALTIEFKNTNISVGGTVDFKLDAN